MNRQGQIEKSSVGSIEFESGSFGISCGQILLFRKKPRSSEKSPVEAVFGHPVRDCLPAYRRSFAPEWHRKADILEKREHRAKELRTKNLNSRAHPLQPFQIGDVWLSNIQQQ